MTKKRFRCRIGLHDWQRVEGSSAKCGQCPACLKTYCDRPVWDKVCIVPGCRVIDRTATRIKERRQKAKEIMVDRDHLAALKMELINDEEQQKVTFRA